MYRLAQADDRDPGYDVLASRILTSFFTSGSLDSMRTTLNIADDVLAAARSLAAQKHRPLGDVISDLARKALTRPSVSLERNRVPLLPANQKPTPVTMELVNGLRDGDIEG